MIFEVYAGNLNLPLNEAHANITLPATPYQLLDIMERLQIEKPEDEYIQIEDYYDCEFLSSYLHGKATITQLNALARKLSKLEEWQKDALEGLLKLDALKEDRLPAIERIIDLAHSTDSCQVLYEARNDAQLGRFYAENGFIPEVENIPDEVFEMLDFEMLGRKTRNGENGIFTQSGYVLQLGETAEVSKAMDFRLKQPDYTVLLKLASWNEDRSGFDENRTALLKLPSGLEEIKKAIRELGVTGLDQVGYRCIDCAVPQTMDLIGEADGFGEIESFASDLKLLQEEGSLTKFKAVLKATQCKDLQTASLLAKTLDAYIFSPKLDTPEKIAEDELRNHLDDAADLLIPHVNLWGYGNAVIEHDGCALTEYGLIDRSDGLPVLKHVGEPSRKGVEMTM